MEIKGLKIQLAIIVIFGFVDFVVNVEEYRNGCTTTSNEPGVCIPILTCKPIVELISSSRLRGSLSHSSTEKIKKLHCGTFKGVHHICCKTNAIIEVTPNKHTGIDIIEENKKACTANNQSGECMPLLECESIVKLLQKSPIFLSDSVVEYVRKSHCGTFHGIHNVCCVPKSDDDKQETTLEHKTQIASVESAQETQKHCITQRNETGMCISILQCSTLRVAAGFCIPMMNCKPFIELLEKSSKPLVAQLIRQSHCGTFNKIPHTCCSPNDMPKTIEPVSKRKVQSDEYSSCKTLRDETGVCVPILKCKTIVNILKMYQQRPPKYIEDIVRSSRCDIVDNTQYVCCKLDGVSND